MIFIHYVNDTESFIRTVDKNWKPVLMLIIYSHLFWASFFFNGLHIVSHCFWAWQQTVRPTCSPLTKVPGSSNVCHFLGGILWLSLLKVAPVPFLSYQLTIVFEDAHSLWRDNGSKGKMASNSVGPNWIVSFFSDHPDSLAEAVLSGERERNADKTLRKSVRAGGKTGADLRWKIDLKTTATKRLITGSAALLEGPSSFEWGVWRGTWGSWSGLKCCPVYFFPQLVISQLFLSLFLLILTLPAPTRWSENDCKTGSLLAAREVQIKF